MHNQQLIFSIFGDMDRVVAEAMITEGVCHKIEFDDIPLSARYSRGPDGIDRAAFFAIAIPSNLVNTFEMRVRNLRA